MRKMIKFIPLAIAPALAIMACANSSKTTNSYGVNTNNVVNNSSDNSGSNASATTFNITVMFNGGTVGGLPSQQYSVRKGTYYKYYKTKLPKASDITYADHTFKHYSLTRDGEEVDGQFQFNGDTTIFAVYDPVAPEITFTVTWKNDGGSVLATETNFYHKSELPSYKGEEPTPEDPTPGTEYKFTGWTPAITPIVDANQEYTATYQPVSSVYTITFDAAGGTPVAAKTVDAGTQIDSPSTEKTGYTFAGWWDGAQQITFPYTVNGNKTFTAHWTANKVRITFDPDGGTWGQGGTDPKPVDVDYNKMPAPGDTLTKAGYTFTGWDPALEPATATKTYTAQWKATPTYYTISFDTDGGTSVDAKTVEAGQQIATSPTTTKTGWDFAGWYDGETPVSFPYTVNATKTLKAHWDNGSNVHTITFHPENGGETFTGTVRNGERLVAPSVPVYSGHKFNGWFTAATGGTQFDFSTVFTSETATTDLYAQWTADPTPTTYYTVTFDTQGGSNVKSQQIASGGKVADPGVGATTKVGYDFGGWYKEAACTNAWVFNTDTVTDNTTIYAKWEDGSNVHTITFHDQNGDTETTSEGTVRNGERLAAPVVPTYAGHKFNGWFTEATAGTEFDFSHVFTSSDTFTDLYAHWTADPIPVDKVTVNFDSQGGTSVPGQTIDKGTAATEPSSPTKVGYDFDGWYTAATGGEKWVFTTTIDADKTLYAHWVDGSNVHTITFHNQDGSPETTTTGTARNGERLAAPAVPTYAGHTFLGWYDAASEGTIFNFDTKFDSTTLPDNALYAHWSTDKCTVTFDSQGGSSIATVEVDYNGKVNKPNPDPTYAGHDFLGWFKEAACTTAWVFDTDTVTSNITLYAKWGTLKTNVVTFYDDDGTTKLYEVTTDYGAKVTRPADPTKAEKVFTGWVTTKGGSTAFDFNTPITEATSAYATWTDETYTIRWFNADVNRTLLEIDKNVAKGTTPTYDGATPTLAPDAFHRYTFKGWSPIILPVDADMSYYATYDYDDEISFNYESDSYALDGKFEFTSNVNYGGYIVYSFGELEESDVDFIQNNLTVSIDGGEAQHIDDFTEGSVSIVWDQYGDRIARLSIKAAFGTDEDILNAHDIKVEVIQHA